MSETPKFSVGQIVATRTRDPHYFRVAEIYSAAHFLYRGWYTDTHYPEQELRPLTASEIGPSAAGKRRGANDKTKRRS